MNTARAAKARVVFVGELAFLGVVASGASTVSVASTASGGDVSYKTSGSRPGAIYVQVRHTVVMMRLYSLQVLKEQHRSEELYQTRQHE